MHPGQYTLLNSHRPEVVAAARRDLDYHTCVLELLGLDQTAKIQIHIGELYGDKRAALQRFIERDLPRYAELRNDPRHDATSGLSPYLHFGQISPVEIAWEVSRVSDPQRACLLGRVDRPPKAGDQFLLVYSRLRIRGQGFPAGPRRSSRPMRLTHASSLLSRSIGVSANRRSHLECCPVGPAAYRSTPQLSPNVLGQAPAHLDRAPYIRQSALHDPRGLHKKIWYDRELSTGVTWEVTHGQTANRRKQMLGTGALPL